MNVWLKKSSAVAKLEKVTHAQIQRSTVDVSVRFFTFEFLE